MNRSVMIVESDLYIAKMLSDVLEDESIYTTVFKNGSTALEFFEKRQTNFDCIITDLILPEHSGDELIYEVRLINMNVPIVLMSVEFPPGLAAALHVFNNIYYLQKPFRISSAISTVKSSFNKKLEFNGDIA